MRFRARVRYFRKSIFSAIPHYKEWQANFFIKSLRSPIPITVCHSTCNEREARSSPRKRQGCCRECSLFFAITVIFFKIQFLVSLTKANEICYAHFHHGGIAQLVEHTAHIRSVCGSIPHAANTFTRLCVNIASGHLQNLPFKLLYL